MPTYTSKTKIIFLNLPTDIQKEVDAVRQTYNPAGVKRGKAHITFKQDEDFTLKNEALLTEIEKFTHPLSPFTLQIDGIKIKYHQESYTIYISFKEHPELKKAIAQLSKNIEKYIDKESPGALSSTHWEQSPEFFPHITITTGKGKQQGEELLQEILALNINLPDQITCDSLSFCEWTKDHWEKIRLIELNS